MKRREFLIRLGELSLLGMSVSLSGCISSDNDATGSSNSELVDTADAAATTTATPTMTPTTSSSLAGTCPRGKSCTRPECQLWSDLNSNNKCDRGYGES